MSKRLGTLIATVSGVQFYEHATLGDDVGLIAVWNGAEVQTDYYDVPDVAEVGFPEDFMQTYA